MCPGTRSRHSSIARVLRAAGRDGADGGYVAALITKDGKAIGNITRAD
jgi:hypothetical protein